MAGEQARRAGSDAPSPDHHLPQRLCSSTCHEHTRTNVQPRRLVLGLRSVAGAGGGDCLQYADDGGAVLVAGHTVVLAAPDGKSQRFIPGTPEAEAVTALAVSPNKRLLAVAERGEKVGGADAQISASLPCAAHGMPAFATQAALKDPCRLLHGAAA